MSVDSDLISDLLGVVRRQFYSGNDKRFFQERWLLVQAITAPALWFDERGVKCNDERYRSLILGRLREIKEHGQVAQIRRFPAYLLHSIQTHLKHHGEEIYVEAKAIREKVDLALQGLAKMPKNAPDGTVEALVMARKALKSGPVKRSKTRETQGELF